MELKQARELHRSVEISIMKMIRNFEERTGCTITQASMQEYEDTRFFAMVVFLGRESKKGK